MTDYKTGMGKRIRQRRNALGFTQEELAEQLGVSVKHLSETERGLSGLSVENLCKLSDLFGVTLDELIRGTEAASDRWAQLLPQLRTVPPEKAEAAYQLIRQLIVLLK